MNCDLLCSTAEVRGEDLILSLLFAAGKGTAWRASSPRSGGWWMMAGLVSAGERSPLTRREPIYFFTSAKTSRPVVHLKREWAIYTSVVGY